MHTFRGRHLGAVCCALVLAASACSRVQQAADGKPTIGAAFYPIEEIVRRVGGDAVHVVTIVPPGQEAHEYEPTPQQVARLEGVSSVFYLGNDFQPNVQKTIATLPGRVHKIDLLRGITLLPVTRQLSGTTGTVAGEQLGDGSDPHVWLDPGNMRHMVVAVRDELSAQHPELASTFAANAAAYDAQLGQLGDAFSAQLQHCRSTVIVTAHRAFGYLAAAYGLRQIAIAGISAAEEPSAKTLQAIAAEARKDDVTTIYFEENLPADLSRTVAKEIGASTSVLDPVESLSRDQLNAGDTYLSIMRSNLADLRSGLGCT